MSNDLSDMLPATSLSINSSDQQMITIDSSLSPPTGGFLLAEMISHQKIDDFACFVDSIMLPCVNQEQFMESIESRAKKMIAEAKEHEDMARRLFKAAEALMGDGKNGDPAKSGPTSRLDELKVFLKAHPGKRRSEIIEETSIPYGTLGFLLKKENGVEKRNMRWYLVED